MKKLLSALLLSIPLLSACSDMFKPKTMTIEYDEEVKLHDGSMIWVHITRHYGLVGEIAHGSAYMPGNVEISWDTGFKGVGRKSVYFNKSVSIINKYDDKWYVVGWRPKYSAKNITNSVNCAEFGSRVKGICLVSVNQQGDLLPANIDDVHKINKMNILYPIGIDDWGSVPKFLDGKKLTWQDKLALQKRQSEQYRKIGKDILVLTKLKKTS